MVKQFEVLEDCPAQGVPVVLGGVKVVTPSAVVTALDWCARARQCEQEHGSLLELPACRLHDVPSTEPIAAAAPASVPAVARRTRVAVPADIADLVPAYLENRRREAKRLADAATAGDFGTIDLIAQRMAGGGAMFGFEEITELGRSLRSAVAKKDLREMLQAVAAYEAYLAALKVTSGGQARKTLDEQAANAAQYFG
jgi:hypothetical protein